MVQTKHMQKNPSLWLTSTPFMLFTFLPLFLQKTKEKKKHSNSEPRGEGEDTVSCKTYALNIRAIKLVKLKAILENRKRNIYASGSG